VFDRTIIDLNAKQIRIMRIPGFLASTVVEDVDDCPALSMEPFMIRIVRSRDINPNPIPYFELSH